MRGLFGVKGITVKVLLNGFKEKRMEEKKLTDEEITKGLENWISHDCTAKQEDLVNALDLIKRLMSEKAEYERKLANGDLVPVKELVDKGELVSIDWHNEQVLHDANVIEEQKEEIERLEKDVHDMSWIIKIHKYCVGANHCKNRSDGEFELQKQVDELKEKQVIECHGMLKGCDMVKQAVKDTAKEILAWWVEWLPANEDYHWLITTFEKLLEERYGIEVE
jgi:hypothetical protein